MIEEAAKSRILFVDDEPHLLKMLQMALHRMTEWDASFVESGEAALALMETRQFDVVISDMRMPRMSGAQFLNEVMRRSPRTLRIILSGFADQALVMSCIGATHQYLTKPCSLETLRAVLRRLRKLNTRLNSPELKELTGKIVSLPSIPSLYYSIMDALQDPNCSTDRIGEVVSSDPAMTAKLLQLVNSAFFGFARNVSSSAEAVQLLGLDRIRGLALSLLIFNAFESRKLQALSIEAVWKHSLKTALGAQRIAQMETDDEAIGEQSFTAGLLHDLGKLIFADSLPEKYAAALSQSTKEKRPLVQQEIQTFGASHAELGAYVLEMWGLPVPLVEAVAWHHAPGDAESPDFGPLTTVHVANALFASDNTARSTDFVSKDYLNAIGKADRLAEWHKALCSRK
jgi:putative nucleotidyltransferase with HDIG domain